MELYPIYISVIISIFINSLVDYEVFAKPHEEIPPWKGVIGLAQLSFMAVGLIQIITAVVYWFILDLVRPSIHSIVLTIAMVVLNITIYSLAQYIYKTHPDPDGERRLVTMLTSKHGNPDVQFEFKNEAEQEGFENMKKLVGRPGIISWVALSLTFVIGVPVFVLFLYLLK